MTRSSRRKKALTYFRFPDFSFQFFSWSLLTSAATSGTTPFERHLPEIMAALEQNSLVELDRQTVRVIG